MDKWLAKLALIILIIIGLGYLPFSDAVEVEGLYQVKIPVADQTPKTRWGAVLDGFKEILVRKSGSRQALSTSEVRQAYRKVTAYLQRFQYSTNNLPDNEHPYILQLDFEPRLIDELIQGAGMPIWGSNRPVTILWLATEQNFRREVIKEDLQPDSFSSLIMENAKRRGIPVILPLMDLEDELNVTISDIWGRFNSSVVTASERYAADSVVTGRISQLGENWQAKLSYINQGSEQLLDFSQATPELLMEALTDQLAELLCQKYCVVETVTSHQIRIQVSGVGNFANFKGVQQHLENLSSIRKVEVDKISATNVRFNIALLGDLQSVKDGIALANKLAVEEAPIVDPFKTVLADQPEVIDQQQTPMPLETMSSTEGEAVTNLLADDQSQQTDSQQIDLQPDVVAQEEVILYYRWLE